MTVPLSRPEHSSKDQGRAQRLPASTRSPAMARSIVRTACAEFPADTRDTAELLVSELVTNAVRDTTTSLLLSIDTSGAGISIAVTDATAATPDHTTRQPTTNTDAGSCLSAL